MVCWVDGTLDWVDVPIPWDVTVALVSEPGDNDDCARMVVASVMYTCPEPFDTEELAAADVSISLDLPTGLEFADGERPGKTIPRLGAGTAVDGIWHVRQTAAVEGELIIHAHGTITGHQPYAYRDVIGVRAVTPVKLSALPALARTALRSAGF